MFDYLYIIQMKTQLKYHELPSALRIRYSWAVPDETVVFTNGCFDLLHYGHIDYLEKARSLGDRLIVGLNGDESIRRLKGTDRPITPLESRARVLAALECVDLVVSFEEDTPLHLIETLHPDILAKGGDYTIETIVGSDFVLSRGGEVEIIPLVEGYSTSSIVESIEARHAQC